MSTTTDHNPDPRPPADGVIAEEGDPRRWLILAIMSLGTLIVFLDLTVVNTALPSISLGSAMTRAKKAALLLLFGLDLTGAPLLLHRGPRRAARRNGRSSSRTARV